ncbi:MAG: hypothetical protein JNJ41_09670 [Bacteroidia bacterium]|nr:hypothetical protein [Bacteroidia bacterium]
MTKITIYTWPTIILFGLFFSFTAPQDATSKEKTQPKKIKIQKQPQFVSVKRCVIYVPKDYCYFPKSANFATSFNRDSVQFDYIDCKLANETENISCIWLCLLGNENSKLTIEDQLKNFALIKGKDKIEHPFMIKISSEPKFLGANFKGKNITANYSKQIDIFLYFKNVNAKPGEKFRINNLTTTITT